MRLSTIRLRLTRFSCSRYASKRDSMSSRIGLQLMFTYLLLFRHLVCFATDFFILVSSSPVFIVYKIAKSRRIDDSQSQFDAIFLQICSCGLNFYSLRHFVRQFHIFFGRIELCVEQSVDERRLSKSRFTLKEKECQSAQPDIGRKRNSTPPLSLSFSLLVYNNIPTTMQVNWKPFLTDLRWTWLGRFAKPTYPWSFLRTTVVYTACKERIKNTSFCS